MPTQDSTDIGARLKVLRGEESQEQFARRIGITRSALANYELGRTKPKPSLLKKISEALGLSDDFLLHGRVRNEYELNRVAAGRGMINESHESYDELAMIHALRAATPETIKSIVGQLLEEIEEKATVRSRLTGLHIADDLNRLGKIYQADGVFQQGGDESTDPVLAEMARRARAISS